MPLEGEWAPPPARLERSELLQRAVDELHAIEPSPTADATRLTLPERTSPTQKTPGMLVSIR